MQAVAVSTVKQTCESVLGYFVSKYENELSHCDSVVEKAIERYCKSRQD